MRKKVSIVIANRNYSEFIAESIRSCLNQEFNSSFIRKDELEILVIDDGSEDDSVSVAREVAESSSEIPVRVFELEHGGRSRARNYGIKQSDSDYMVFLDSDDLLDKKYLFWTISAIELMSEAPLVYSWYYVYNPPEKVILRPVDFSYDQLYRKNFILITALIRRQVIEEKGAFDERLELLEDWDLFLRLCEWGKPHLVPMPLFYYRRHPKSSTAVNGPNNAKISAYHKLVSENWRNRYQDIDFEEFRRSIPDMWVACKDCAVNTCNRKFPEGTPRCCNQCEIRYQCELWDCPVFNAGGKMNNKKKTEE